MVRESAGSQELIRFLMFLSVGCAGFLVDAAILTLLVKLADANVFVARAISFAQAVTVTWYLNRNWTFAATATAKKKFEYARYFMVQTLGALVNLGTFVLVLTASPHLQEEPLVPLATGAAITLFFNYVMLKHHVFRAIADRM